jgi:hypothetical protein
MAGCARRLTAVTTDGRWTADGRRWTADGGPPTTNQGREEMGWVKNHESSMPHRLSLAMVHGLWSSVHRPKSPHTAVFAQTAIKDHGGATTARNGHFDRACTELVEVLSAGCFEPRWNAEQPALSPSVPATSLPHRQNCALPDCVLHEAMITTPIHHTHYPRKRAAMPDPSPALRAANERLLALRAQLDRQRSAEAAHPQPEPTQTPAETAVGPPPPDTHHALPDALPAHLGWDSPAVTTALRARQQPETAVSPETQAPHSSQPPSALAGHNPNSSQPTANAQLSTGNCQLSTANQPPSSLGQAQGRSFCPLPSSFQIHPSLALALLRGQQVAAGRLWLLLRLLDSEGRGWLAGPTSKLPLPIPIPPPTSAPLVICASCWPMATAVSGSARAARPLLSLPKEPV